MSGDSGEINLPFDLSIGYQIRLTHRLMQKLLQLKIEQFGVTLGMWYFLRVLWDQDGLTQKELSDLVGTMEPTALLQRLAAVRGRLSLCADQAAAAKWWLSMPMASVSAEGPMPKALSTRRTSPLMPGCRHQGRACPLRRARMTSNPLIVA